MRAVIFTDIRSSTSMALSRATIEAARTREFDVCGFVTANPDEMFQGTRERLGRRARRLAIASTGGPRNLRNNDVTQLARRHDLPFLTTTTGVNNPDFIDRLHGELAPDVLLSYFCVQILRQPLLDSVAQAVNYHDGLLPHYAGLAATSQSVYAGETRSGYTFHRMTTGIDDGPILVQGDVAVDRSMTSRDVTRAKLQAATARVPEVVDLIIDAVPGRPQQGPGSYFDNAAYKRLAVITDPSDLTAAELHRRLRACGSLSITIDGESEPVTELASAEPTSPMAFETADGTWMRASRIDGVPTKLIAGRRALRTRVGV